MKSPKTALYILLVYLVGCLSAWLVRGAYDRLFMMEGHFHVVNVAGEDRAITLTFPSGRVEKLDLKSPGSADLKIKNTGEGSVGVSVDGGSLEQVGYVTSWNGIVVLVIGKNETVFSQVFEAPPIRWTANGLD